MADDWRTSDAQALFNAIRSLESLEETERFFRDLCTLSELRDLAQRWAVVRLLDQGKHYAQISRETGASTTTDEEGRFRFRRVPRGEVTLAVRAPGRSEVSRRTTVPAPEYDVEV